MNRRKFVTAGLLGSTFLMSQGVAAIPTVFSPDSFSIFPDARFSSLESMGTAFKQSIAKLKNRLAIQGYKLHEDKIATLSPGTHVIEFSNVISSTRGMAYIFENGNSYDISIMKPEVAQGYRKFLRDIAQSRESLNISLEDTSFTIPTMPQQREKGSHFSFLNDRGNIFSLIRDKRTKTYRMKIS